MAEQRIRFKVGASDTEPPSLSSVLVHPDVISPNSDAVDDVAEVQREHRARGRSVHTGTPPEEQEEQRSPFHPSLLTNVRYSSALFL